MVVLNNEEPDIMQLWSMITQLGEQLSQNQAMSVSLYTTAGKIKNQASNLQSGFVLRRFNLDKSQEEYDAALEQMSAGIAAENQGLLHDNKQLSSLIKEYEQTLETLMSTFRNRAQHVQERELSLIREFESKLLAREEENAKAELQANATISNAISRLSFLFRQLLRAHGGETLEDTNSVDEAEEQEPWALSQTADYALEREIELERLQNENEELRRMAGLAPPQSRVDASESHSAFDPRRADAFQQRPGSKIIRNVRPALKRVCGDGQCLPADSWLQIGKSPCRCWAFGTRVIPCTVVPVSSIQSRLQVQGLGVAPYPDPLRRLELEARALSSRAWTPGSSARKTATLLDERRRRGLQQLIRGIGVQRGPLCVAKMGGLRPFSLFIVDCGGLPLLSGMAEQTHDADGEAREAMAFATVPYSSTSPACLTVPSFSARPRSPSLFARRRNSTCSTTTEADTMFGNIGNRNRLSIVSQGSRTSDKGKTPIRRDSPGNGESSLSTHPFATYDRVVSASAPSSSSTNGFNHPRKNRNSFLGAASDAFSLKFGRKSRPAGRQASAPLILPGVIEISAPPPDQEVEERERLREMAAQAIGISPLIVHGDTHSQEESTEDEDDDALRTPADTSELRRFGDTRNSESTPDVRNKSWLETSSITTTTTPMRFRSGSVASHSRQNSIVATPIPSFPTNVLSLNPFLACSAYFPKYTQPSSLRRLALASKNWKTRYIVLSGPTNPLSRNPASNISYIHVFKSSGPDDKELERLQIHTESAVFVADEEVGGRGNVVRIKGFEVVPGKAGNHSLHEALWQLQIIDPVESQKWISAIKSAILGQRTLAAGLVIPTTPTGAEPRGDLDVIMKIRSQGLTSTTPSAIPSPTYDAFPPRSPTEHNYASSISSQSVQSQATTPRPATSSGPVSALKTLFSSRPRSGSRATSFSADTEQRDHTEESFSSMGNNLLGRLRSGTPESSRPLSIPAGQRNVVPFAFHTTPADRLAERRALVDRRPAQWVEQAPIANRQSRSLSVGALSLQPPPRKRWASLLPPDAEETRDELGYNLLNAEPVVTEVFGRPSTDSRAETEPSSPVESTMFPMDADQGIQYEYQEELRYEQTLVKPAPTEASTTQWATPHHSGSCFPHSIEHHPPPTRVSPELFLE
ncbi:hypothetical protein NMY22_g8029 [Coprinellus aureogranulatus]|nr:hypothetical protein NMY22_g8029 [Coprinellus aureogranulatus]